MINILIKMIPLYTIWHKPVQSTDSMFYLGMFVLYISWLYSNDVAIFDMIQSYFSYRHMPLTNIILNSLPIKTI